MQDTVNRFKFEYNLDKKEKVAFAGRLDPLAFGKIRLLTGEDIKKKDVEQSHDKIYSYYVIHGFQTDTYDILGLITNNNTNGTVECQSLSHRWCDNLAITRAKSVELKGTLISALDGTL